MHRFVELICGNAFLLGPRQTQQTCGTRRFSFVSTIIACYASGMPRRTEPEPFAAKVGARVRELRLERHMSLAEVATAGDLSKGHLSSIEHGLAAMTIQTIDRLGKALELPASCMLAFAADDERAHVAELVRKLPEAEVKKLRRELTKTAQMAARTPSGRPRS